MSNLHHLLIRGILPLFLLVGCLTPSASAQDDPKSLDPSDIFFQAWLVVRDAEKLEKEGKHSDAWRKYRQAAKYYDLLKRYHKNWKPHLVQGRVESTRDAIKAIEPKAAAEIAGKDARTRDLVEGGPNQPSPTGKPNATNNERSPTSPQTPPKAPTPRIAKTPESQVDSPTQRRLRQLEIDNRRLSENLSKLRRNAPANRPEQQRLIKIISQKNREIGILRDILARAPLQQDMERLTKENKTRERELALTAQALKRTQQKLQEAEKTAAKHREDNLLAQRRVEELEKNMQAQKAIDNRVVRELRKELKTVTALLHKTRQELGAANARVTQMQLRLKQSEATIKELQSERDTLKIERDTLANILKKSDSKGVQKLITENMRLGRELKEALDRLEYLENSHNATKDELVQAKSDLAIAKTRIMRYQQEHASQNNMIKSLEKRLRDAQSELTGTITDPKQKASKEEIDMLRATVKRLIAAQERRKMGEKILWDTYQNSKKTIKGMAKAFADIRQTNVELTKEEKALVAARRPDSEFTSPERVSPEHAKAHGAALEREIAMYTPLIKRFFEKGRYEAARETLLELDTRLPGHFPTLCNRGVVEIKTGRYDEAAEIFSEAITMRENSGYAHYMLGKSQYLLKDFGASRKSFEHALTLRSNNADTHLYLGNIAGAERRYQQAEHHFQEAIKLNPTNADAYYNLSVIYLQQNKKKDALESYRKALDHGAQPDVNHEQKLSASNS